MRAILYYHRRISRDKIMKIKSKYRIRQVRKPLKRRVEMVQQAGRGGRWLADEAEFIVDGDRSMVCVLFTEDGGSYGVYITWEPVLAGTEPFFTLYNNCWPVYATQAARISLLEPKIVRCREESVLAELELTEEVLGLLIDTLHVGDAREFCPSRVKNKWGEMVHINNHEHVAWASEYQEKGFTISPQMIQEKPKWYRYAVPSRAAMPEYQRLLHPDESFAEYWRRRHGDKTAAEIRAELRAKIKRAGEIHDRRSDEHEKLMELYKTAFLNHSTETPCEYAVLRYEKGYPINFHLPAVLGRHGIRGCRTMDSLDIPQKGIIDCNNLLIVNDEHHHNFFADVERFAGTQRVRAVYKFPQSRD